jgi:hypothetical protein
MRGVSGCPDALEKSHASTVLGACTRQRRDEASSIPVFAA